MAAFDRIQSGIPEMDEALENIRLGDNVVWRLSHPAEFRYIAEPFVRRRRCGTAGGCSMFISRRYQLIPAGWKRFRRW